MQKHKIAHRDIKLENLILDSNLNLMIADFGSAAQYDVENSKASSFDSAVVVGSQEYNAPEINMDKSYCGDKADTFSCAVCLFMMVIGGSPFRVASRIDPYFRLLSKKEKAEYWKIYAEVPASKEFKDLFERLAERNPEKRIALAKIRDHPWMKKEVMNPSELMEELRDRLQIFDDFYRTELERYRKKLEECKARHDCELLQRPSQDTLKDPLMQAFIAECSELNLLLDKQRTADCLDEKLLDDQVSSSAEEGVGKEGKESFGEGRVEERGNGKG